MIPSDTDTKGLESHYADVCDTNAKNILTRASGRSSRSVRTAQPVEKIIGVSYSEKNCVELHHFCSINDH